MSLTIRHTRAAARTSIGTQDFTVSGFGTPVAAIFVVTRAVTDGTIADHAVLAWGVTDGTNDAAYSIYSEDNLATSDRGVRQPTTLGNCIDMVSLVDGSADGQASFDSWITDGVRINVGDAFASGYLITCILLGGTDLSAHVALVNMGIGGVGSTVETTCGFEPEALMTCYVAGDFLSLGVGAYEAGAFTQTAYARSERDNRGTSQIGSNGSDSWVSVDVGFDGNYDMAVEWTARSATSYTYTMRNAAANNQRIITLALGISGGYGAEVFNYTTPTATGDSSVSGMGIDPTYVYMMAQSTGAYETGQTGANANNQGVVSIDGEGDIYSNISNVEDGQATSDTKSLSDDTLHFLTNQGDANALVATHSSWDTGGFTLNYSSVTLGAGKHWRGLGIETDDAGGAAGISIPVVMHHVRQQRK